MARLFDASIVTEAADGGRIADNILAFARVLCVTGVRPAFAFRIETAVERRGCGQGQIALRFNF
jgi:hypothetical protein